MKLIVEKISNYGYSIKTLRAELEITGSTSAHNIINNVLHLLTDLGYSQEFLLAGVKSLAELNTEKVK